MKTSRIEEILNSNFNDFALSTSYPNQVVNRFYEALHSDLTDLVVEERLKVLNLLEVKGLKISEENKKFILGV